MSKDEKVTLEVLNHENKIIWTSPYKSSKGFNEFRWDIIYNSVNSDLPYFIHYNNYLPAGKYKINIKTSDKKLEENFNIYEYYQ